VAALTLGSAVGAGSIGAPAAAAKAASRHAATVLVLDHGRIERRRQSFAGPTELTPYAATASAGQRPRAGASAAKRAPKGRATRQAIDRLLAEGQIDQATRDARQLSLRRALRAHQNLTGTRKLQLAAVIDNADAISAAGALTPSRLPPVFATLDANTTWWTTGSLLASGARVSIGSSQVIWQYYPGQGIQLQMLANFGKANALWSGKRTTTLRRLLDELTPLAADRGGWPAFEYYFKFGTGKPPWTSSISQGTAVQALGRAGQLLGDPALTDLGWRALGAFEQPPPAGVRQDGDGGPFYLIYSYAPNLRVINAHLQAVVGLFDFAAITGDGRAQALSQQGDAAAQAVLPTYDTGAWSLYDQSREADLGYHKLTTTFLQNLCKRTSAPAYCDTAARFKSYLSGVPVISTTAQRARAGKSAQLYFDLNKISRVGLTLSRDGQTVFSTSAVVGRGHRFFGWSRPAAPGVYELRVRATDLAGNVSEPATSTLRILPPRK
jgi:hypothetical protein